MSKKSFSTSLRRCSSRSSSSPFFSLAVDTTPTRQQGLAAHFPHPKRNKAKLYPCCHTRFLIFSHPSRTIQIVVNLFVPSWAASAFWRKNLTLHLLGFLGGKTQFLGTRLEVLFPLRFPLKHLGDRRLLVGLNDGEARADFEKRRRAVRCARGNESALVLDAQGVQRDICDLKSKCGVVLLEKVVPNVEGAIHLGSEENTRPRWAPAAVSQVRRVVLGGHLHETVVRKAWFSSA